MNRIRQRTQDKWSESKLNALAESGLLEQVTVEFLEVSDARPTILQKLGFGMPWERSRGKRVP